MPQLYPVVHQNFTTEENKYSVFCKRLHKIVVLTDNLDVCSECPYIYGALQGQGVECGWEDVLNQSFIDIDNPQAELQRVDKLIAAKVLKKG